MTKLIRIADLAKKLDLINPKNKKPLNHILRYWEKEFKFVKPKIINNRRYYNEREAEKLKMIKFLLKNKGLTISGVKNLLNLRGNNLDDYNSDSLQAEYYKEKFKNNSKSILEKIKKLKKYGKKNSFKS
tara:strand:- start:165 stop:551 length:387 start_codon:yes stop_codon:yes gene_type:complete